MRIHEELFVLLPRHSRDTNRARNAGKFVSPTSLSTAQFGVWLMAAYSWHSLASLVPLNATRSHTLYEALAVNLRQPLRRHNIRLPLNFRSPSVSPTPLHADPGIGLFQHVWRKSSLLVGFHPLITGRLTRAYAIEGKIILLKACRLSVPAAYVRFRFH